MHSHQGSLLPSGCTPQTVPGLLPATMTPGQRQCRGKGCESPGLRVGAARPQGAHSLPAPRFPTPPGRWPPAFLPAARAPKGDLHIPGEERSSTQHPATSTPAKPGPVDGHLVPGEPRRLGRVQSQAGKRNTSKRAPSKRLPPGSLPIFQAYLQAMAQRGVSVTCSATGDAGKWRGWQTERWLGQSRARRRRGCGDPGLATAGGTPGTRSSGLALLRKRPLCGPPLPQLPTNTSKD